MVSVRVVQMARDQVISMIAVRHGFMAAFRTVLVLFIVSVAGVLGCAGRGIRRSYCYLVFFDTVLGHVM